MLMTICRGQMWKKQTVKSGVTLGKSISTVNMFSAATRLQGEHKVATDALLSNDVLHGAKRRAQIGVEKLSGQQTHRGGHQVVWQRHICDLKTKEKS